MKPAALSSRAEAGGRAHARHLRSLAFSVFLTMGSAVCAWAEPLSLDPAEMRSAAAQSIAAGKPQQALFLSQALLERDANDVEALVLKSRAQRDMGEAREALDTARLAYRKAEGDVEIYSAALARAQALSTLGARTRAQLWLRMAGEHAPNEQARERTIKDYRYVRSRNRWNTKLSFSVAPTSNVNDGSVHDTISYGGLQGIVLDGSAQALSGLSLSGGLTTRYRFSESKSHQTEVGLHLFHQTYMLSDEAQELAPEAQGSDFAYSSVAIGFRHLWRPDGWNMPLELSFLTGQGWYGGEDYSRYTRSGIARAFALNKDTLLRLEAGGERFYRVIDEATQQSLHANAIMLHEFDNGAGLRLSFGIRDADSKLGSLDYRRLLGEIGYTLPQPIAKARTTLEIGVEHRLYDRFPTLDTQGFWIVMTEKEREDIRGTLGVQLFFDKVEYYGFSPTVTFRHSENHSTDDRYDTVDTGVNFGFRSNF